MQENSSVARNPEQLAAVLDNAPAAVYVSSAESRELLYANDLARKLFLPGDYRPGLTCYEAAGYDKPCPFCQHEKLSRSEFLVRHFQDPNSRCIYQLSGKLIEWGGKPAHIEYIVDITQTQMQKEQARAQSENLQRTFSSIPCGLCIYRYENGEIRPVFHNPAFYEIMGYSEEQRCSVEQETDYLGVFPKDLIPLKAKIDQAIKGNGMVKFDYRVWNDRKQKYSWVHLEGTVKPQNDGSKLLYGVYSDISQQRRLETELMDAKEKMQDIINSIPGGIASYLIEENKFIPIFYSDGVLSFSGHTREEYDALIGDDALNTVYEADRPRVFAAAQSALTSGQVLNFSYRMRHKDGRLVWVHVNGRRIGPRAGAMRFYAVFTGMSAETQLFRNIANETADGIYVIDRETYELLYINESRDLFLERTDCIGEKCYAALHGESGPCGFCTLKSHAPDGKAHDMEFKNNGRFYSTRFRETLWNGIPAYVKFVQDVTEEVKTQKEKERLEQYFQTLVKKLPGGVAVVRFEKDGSKVPEYFSDGFAALVGMTMDEVWQTYRKDGMAGVHPDDFDQLSASLDSFIASGNDHCELVCRLKKGDNSYVWVKNSVSMIQRGEGEFTLYISYRDMTKEREEQEEFRQQYREMILQHYRTPGPNALIVGHCNVTQNRILEISDNTNSGLLKKFGSEREEFFIGLSSLLADEKERQDFRNVFLNKPTFSAFAAGNTELEMDCFVNLPREVSGRYVKFKISLVETPDTGDITGILTVSDITEQTISARNLQQLSSLSYDLIADVDLLRDSSTILSGGSAASDDSGKVGRQSDRLAFMIKEQVVPKDKELVAKMMDPAYMYQRLRQDAAYSFSYSILGEKGEILTKKLTISATDLRLGRICLARADITDSVREQQGLLNVVAYTFEMLVLIRVWSQDLTLYTRQTVLQALQPEQDDYAAWLGRIKENYVPQGGAEEVVRQFALQNMLKRLEERPEGYDFVLPYRAEEGLRYKQFNVLWGDRDRKTVCIVRQDVTDMLTAEHQSKDTLEKALALAKEANQAKSDFLSSMSHDIRTPMNAIMGMTALAEAYLDDRDKVESCLQKISLSSRHLLSLINDILDMSKIERSKITLNNIKISLPDLMNQLSSMMGLQAREAGLLFEVQTKGITHPCFYGDSLRINQILINILGNAIKFTPEGGSVKFLAEEIPPVKDKGYVRYRFTVSDTGLGMSKDFLAQLFEPFTRSRGTTRVEGTGLGLSITKGLVDLMKGEISVESLEHRGSTFRVELECGIAQEGREATAKVEAQAHAGEKSVAGRCFLVAEDNEINAEILSELLQMYGAGVIVKSDGAQAVREFQGAAPGTYDAILMDIQMPEMNGYEATRTIRKLNRADAMRIPIVAMTANAFTEDIQAAMDAGMTAHIAKPIDIQVLLETLDKLML